MILNVYKPKDWTSHDVVAKARAVLREKRGTKKVKVGHAGTLDPLAEGVLIVLTDEDTKKQDEVMKMPKEYFAKIAFGALSSTYDLEGKLTVADTLPNIEDIKLRLKEKLPTYIGKIKQAVPLYSAKKVKGKPLYKYARKGGISDLKWEEKEVEIFDIKIKSFREEKVQEAGKKLPVLTCVIKCGKGTYIRSIAHELGLDLGFGGVLIHLVRTKVGNYKVEDAIKISEFPARLA